MDILLTERDEAVFFFLDGRAQVWNIQRGKKIKDLVSDRIDFSYANMSPNRQLVGVVSRGRKNNSSAIVFWNIRDWTRADKLETAETIHDFCFSPDSQQIIACVGHPTDEKDHGFTGIIAWNVTSKKEVARIEYGTGFPIRIAVSPDGRWVATGGGDAVPVGANSRSLSGHLRIFDWQNKVFQTEPFELPTDYVRSLQFSPDSKFLYSGAIGEVRAYRAGDWAQQWVADLGTGNPHDLVVSPNGTDIVVDDSNHLNIIDAKDGKLRGTKLKFRFYPEDKPEIDKLLTR